MAPKKEAHPKKDQEKADEEIRVIVEISLSKKMNVFKYCEKIIYSKSLEEKLLDPGLVTCFEFQKTKEIPKRPYRPDNFSFTESKAKFPKPGSLKENKNKIVALQFFANHELLAIEMMASAIILFYKTVNSEDFKTISKGILSTIKDEQKHF